MNTKQNIIRRVTPVRITRRTFLSGAFGGLGVALPLPVLDAMLDQKGQALAATGQPLPIRFGVFHWGGGVNHKTWVPSATGAAFPLPPSLVDFADLRDHLTVVTGLSHEDSSPGHIPARGIALSNSHDLTKCQGNCVGTYRGQNMPEPSLDALVAEAWRGQAAHDLIAVGICRKGPYASNSSWNRGGATYNRHEPSPQALFERLFSTSAPGKAPAPDGLLEATTRLRRSMLDVLMEDTRTLSAQLGSTDKARLAQHLEGLRSIESGLQARQELPAGGGCDTPEAPNRKDFGDGGSREEKEPKSKLMSDLLAVALACDLTRVFSYEWSANQSQSIYWEVDSKGQHHEDITHGKSQSEEHTRIITFIMKNFAYLARRLKQMPEGSGSVLDRTLIFATSEHADAGNHDYEDHPLLLVGKAGGRIKSGVHVRGSGTNAPRVMFSAVKAVGVQVARLGQEGRAVSGGLAEIETRSLLSSRTHSRSVRMCVDQDATVGGLRRATGGAGASRATPHQRRERPQARR